MGRDRPLNFARICGIVVVLNIVLNLVLIPARRRHRRRARGGVSSVALALLGAHRMASLTGGLSLLRAFAGPVVAGAALAATMLAGWLPLLPEAALGAAAYLLVLLLLERRLFPADFALARSLLAR